MRAELVLHTLTVAPPRGSIRDRIITELLWRRRKREISGQTYLARIIAAGFNIPEGLIKFWTDLYTMEVMQESYMPKVITAKSEALLAIEKETVGKVEEQNRLLDKVNKLSLNKEDMRPLTAQELEEYKRRIRKRYVE